MGHIWFVIVYFLFEKQTFIRLLKVIAMKIYYSNYFFCSLTDKISKAVLYLVK